MRPECLYPLFKPQTSLPGVGPRLGPILARLCGGEHVAELLWLLPCGLIDRRYCPKIAEAPSGSVVSMTVQVVKHLPSATSRSPYRVICEDETGSLTLTFFHAKGDYLARQLPEGQTRVVSGRVERYQDSLQMSHPDHIVSVEERESIARIEPVYPLTAGLSPKVLARAIASALDAASEDFPEWLDPEFVKRQGWATWKSALRSAHAPQGEADLTPLAPARQRLAYDELLANQLALLLVRRDLRRLAGRVIAGDGRLREKTLAALPYRLTGAQERALAEIQADMASPDRMLRLLQGDVGSGKTVVAYLSMLNAVETGLQAALMVPTEILARQHGDSLAPLAQAAGVRLAVLTGRDKGKARQATLDALEAGEVDILVGTHALFQKDVAFKELGLAVIDEQHRFGVHQRLSLSAKGKATDMLVMTATPIPRTLALTAYGDMDATRIEEKPPGRQPIVTLAKPTSALADVAQAVGRAIDSGAKAFWVCPLVEESETSDVAAAEERFGYLQRLLGPERVGLIHGRMKGPDKDAVMEAFAGEGGPAVLVATTVIEVGVDVPQATVMVIEHAERFGLAQLHQLRGRIGRGQGRSTCLLLYAPPLNATAQARLERLRETEDGFEIAEEDLRLRGGGEVLGTRQSGLPEFRLADLTSHGELLATARQDAQLILERDPELTTERGQALKTLLYLFERDAAVRTLRSG